MYVLREHTALTPHDAAVHASLLIISGQQVPSMPLALTARFWSLALAVAAGAAYLLKILVKVQLHGGSRNGQRFSFSYHGVY